MITVEEEEDVQSDSAQASTPNRAGLGIQNAVSPGDPLASSPLLRDSLQPPSTLYPPPAGSSRASSIRLSRDSEDLRSHGVEDSELYENGSMYSGLGDTSDQNQGGTSVGGSVFGDESMDEGQQEAADTINYSHLSRRADFILENAKRKLNLLEGNLKGARSSLAVPSLPTIHSPTKTEFSHSRSGSKDSPTASSDDGEKRGLQGPRINFGAPRQAQPTSTPPKSSPLHSRGFSENAVGYESKRPVNGTRDSESGSRSLDLPRDAASAQRNPLLRGPAVADKDANLATVPENNPSAARRFPVVPRRVSSSDGRSPLASTKDLRIQAEELRGRLSYIQEKVRDDSIKRRSLGWNTPAADVHEVVLHDQVKSVQQSLDQQDEVLSQLESVEQSQHGDLSRSGSRAEWQRVLDHHRAPGGESPNSSEEAHENGNENEEDFVSVLEQPMLDDEEFNLDGRHEDRADAFDYEHFILHSGMGNFSNVAADRRSSSSSSSSSDSTTRGEELLETNGAEEASGGDWDELQQPNASVMSFASYETAAEVTSSDSASDSSGLASDELLANNGTWPMPPQSSGAPDGQASPDSDVATPIGRAFNPPERKRNSHTRRPASLFLSALKPVQSSPGLALSEEDQERFYALAECLQHISARLQDPETDPFDKPVWRARLEEARRMLSADF